MSDASTRVMWPVRPEEQLTSSSIEGGIEGGVRSGTQEQDEIRDHSVPELGTELAENEGKAEEEAPANPLRDARDPTAAERAIHEATHSVRGATSVPLGGVVTRREFPKTRTQCQKS